MVGKLILLLRLDKVNKRVKESPQSYSIYIPPAGARNRRKLYTAKIRFKENRNF